MFHVHRVDNLDLPELAPYRTMRRSVEHQRAGIFVAEGDKVVRRLLDSAYEVISLLVPPSWPEQVAGVLGGRPESIPVFVADKKTLESLTGFSFYQGVLAVGRIPKPVHLDHLLKSSKHPSIFVALDSLTNAENLGVVVRNCAAFGVDGLIVGETCSSPFLRRSVRSSMGGIFDVPSVQVDNLEVALHKLAAQGIACVAAHPRSESRNIWEINLARDCCLVFGSEGYGLSQPVLAACSETAAIPMTSAVDSLNVGNATGVFLYEALRQRRLKIGNRP